MASLRAPNATTLALCKHALIGLVLNNLQQPNLIL